MTNYFHKSKWSNLKSLFFNIWSFSQWFISKAIQSIKSFQKEFSIWKSNFYSLEMIFFIHIFIFNFKLYLHRWFVRFKSKLYLNVNHFSFDELFLQHWKLFRKFYFEIKLEKRKEKTTSTKIFFSFLNKSKQIHKSWHFTNKKKSDFLQLKFFFKKKFISINIFHCSICFYQQIVQQKRKDFLHQKHKTFFSILFSINSNYFQQFFFFKNSTKTNLLNKSLSFSTFHIFYSTF